MHHAELGLWQLHVTDALFQIYCIFITHKQKGFLTYNHVRASLDHKRNQNHQFWVAAEAAVLGQ
jgi:hypothetical protein